MSSLVATIMTMVPMVANLTVPFLAKRLGKRNLYSTAATVQLVGLVIIFIGNLNTTIIIVGAFISACGYGVKESIYFSMQADPVDYGEWKTGIQAAGTLSSVNGFLGKVAQAAAGGISGLLLAWGAYSSTATVQTAEALLAIKAMYLYIPMILLVCSIVTMSFYKLDKLRLQALANYATFDNVELVKRCLYLFAGMTTEEGKISSNVFVKPENIPDDTFLYEYSLFFYLRSL